MLAAMKKQPRSAAKPRNAFYAQSGGVTAVINGRRRHLTIAGVVLSPEYVYAIRPNDMFPDARRFGVFWMNHRALASAFDMEGGFNDVAVTLASAAPVARLAVARKAAAVSWIMMGWNTEARRIYEANGASIEDGTCYCKLSGETLERLAS